MKILQTNSKRNIEKYIMEQQLINKEKLASEPKVKDHFMMKICGVHMDRVRSRVGCNMMDY
jgi:hypothetical protein